MLIRSCDLVQVLWHAAQMLDSFVDAESIEPGLRALAAEALATLSLEECVLRRMSDLPAQVPLDAFMALRSIAEMRTVAQQADQPGISAQSGIVGALLRVVITSSSHTQARLFKPSSTPSSADSTQLAPHIDSVVDLALARLGTDAVFEAVRKAQARAALHRANANGLLLEYVQRQSWDPLMLSALANAPDLLNAVKNSARSTVVADAWLRAVVEEIDRRYR